MSTEFNQILNAVSGEVQYKVFSKLTEKTGTNISLDELSREKEGKDPILLFTPTDAVFLNMDKFKFAKIASLTKENLREFINLHIVGKAKPIGNTGNSQVYNTAGAEYVVHGDKDINDIPLTGKGGLWIGKIAIVPINGILTTKKLDAILTN